jgi:uncharacterized protein (TIGR00369 family)
MRKALDSVPYAHLLGIELDEVSSGTATLGLNLRKELTQNHGVIHGGAIASLIDSATAFAIISLLAPKEKVTTVDLTISYLRPLMNGRIIAVAKVVRAGRRLIVVSAEVTGSDGKLAATALSTYIKL